MTLLGHWTRQIAFSSVAAMALAAGTAAQANSHDDSFTGSVGHMHSIDVPAPQPGADAGEARWLAGDHHTHSRFSTGYDEKADPPTPTVGGDAIYPIPMNALMARKFGLDWMVATDHGGPNHSKVNHDHAYPELLRSRQLVPELVQFFGMEFDTPGADHSSIIVPAGDDEADRLRELEKGYGAREAWPRDPSRNSEGRMLDALRTMDAQQPKPVLFAHHPSRSATGMGKYGLTTPSKLRGWNDTAPEVAIGMEGAPGHQAAGQVGESVGPSRYAAYFGDAIPRGAYGDFPTMGGFDQMTARLGGFWDSMLGEGRRWWITANSDSHINWTEGGFDFWPGEYSKTYVHAPKNPASIIAAMRAGRIFVTTGDLVSELEILLGTGADARPIEFGSTINVGNGEPLHLTIRFRDPDGLNANGDNPAVHHIDLIRGSVGTKSADPNLDRNPSTRVVARFTEAEWKREGEWRVIETALEPVAGDEYLRLRGTNTEDAEPAPDAEGEDAWTDLWFYSNPVFLGSSMRRNP